jgi:hypothetical protein
MMLRVAATARSAAGSRSRGASNRATATTSSKLNGPVPSVTGALFDAEVGVDAVLRGADRVLMLRFDHPCGAATTARRRR